MTYPCREMNRAEARASGKFLSTGRTTRRRIERDPPEKGSNTMKKLRRLAAAIAVLGIGIGAAACTSPVAPDSNYDIGSNSYDIGSNSYDIGSNS